MRRIAFFSIFMIAATVSHGQLWFDVGLKGGGGSGFLKSSVIKDDSRLTINPGYNYFFGGKVGINYGYYVSIATDITYGKNSFSFNQAELFGSATTYKYTVNYNAMCITPLFRFTKEASYLEAGPEFVMVKKPTISDEATSLTNFSTDRINTKMTNLVFGFGGYIVGNDVVALQMGLRVHYSLSNLTHPDYESSNFPFSNYSDIAGGSETNPFTVQLHLELNFSLGQIARSSSKCGRRVAFVSF